MIDVFGIAVATIKWRKDDIVLGLTGCAPKSIRQIIARINNPCPKTATNSDLTRPQPVDRLLNAQDEIGERFSSLAVYIMRIAS